MNDPIKLQNAGLSEKDGEIIAHGWLDLDSIKLLKVDDYQREVLAKVARGRGHKPGLVKAVEEGARLPDIILGMRGELYHSRGSNMFLENSVYVIDGLQRISAMMRVAEDDDFAEKAKGMLIGAEVRFNTTRTSEKDLFAVLNGSRIPVSPNVILRNSRDTNKAVLTLYGLSTNDKTFALCNRTQWTQRRARGELTTALTLVKVAYNLHRFIRAGGQRRLKTSPGNGGSVVLSDASTLEQRVEKIGLKIFRENVITFFEMVDKAYGIRNVEFTETATQMRSNFLNTLARLISDHENFWDGNKLQIDSLTIKKLASFPILDPEIGRLAGAGSQTLPILYNYLRDHLNKGKRINRLKARKRDANEDIADGEEE